MKKCPVCKKNMIFNHTAGQYVCEFGCGLIVNEEAENISD